MGMTLWIYQHNGSWFAHVDYGNGRTSKREGPFESEAQAERVMSRKYGSASEETEQT